MNIEWNELCALATKEIEATLAELPAELRERISADVRAVAADPVVTDRLTVTAQVVNPGSPTEFAAAIDEQRAKMAKIAQRLGIKPAQ